MSSTSATSLAEKPEHLAQDQDGALLRRQVLKRRDERQLDALALLVARFGPEQLVADVEGLVRVRLDPHRLDERLADAVVRVGGRSVVDRQHPLRTPRDHVQARVRGDLVEPGAQRAARGESRQAAPGTQQRVLQRILRVVDRAEHAVAVGVELAPVRLDQAPEGILIARSSRLEQFGLQQCHRPEITLGAR